MLAWLMMMSSDGGRCCSDGGRSPVGVGRCASLVRSPARPFSVSSSSSCLLLLLILDSPVGPYISGGPFSCVHRSSVEEDSDD